MVQGSNFVNVEINPPLSLIYYIDVSGAYIWLR